MAKGNHGGGGRNRRDGGGPAPDTEDEIYADPGSRALDGQPGPTHEAFMAEIDEKITRAMSEYLPTMGTVLGMEGGEVIVSLDSELGDRELGIPRIRGIRHLEGDRVKVQKLRGGQFIAEGTTSTKAGEDPAVDDDDIFTDAITSRHLKQNAVDREALAPGAVGTDHFSDNANNYFQSISAAANQGIAAAGTANAGVAAANQRIQNVEQDINQGPNSIRNRISEINQAIGNQGLKGDINALSDRIGNFSGDIRNLQTQLDRMKDDINKLKNK